MERLLYFAGLVFSVKSADSKRYEENRAKLTLLPPANLFDIIWTVVNIFIVFSAYSIEQWSNPLAIVFLVNMVSSRYWNSPYSFLAVGIMCGANIFVNIGSGPTTVLLYLPYNIWSLMLFIWNVQILLIKEEILPTAAPKKVQATPPRFSKKVVLNLH